MIPFLGVDITSNKENDVFNGDAFLVAKAPAEQVERLQQLSDKMMDHILSDGLSPRLKRIKNIFLIAVALCVAVALYAIQSAKESLFIWSIAAITIFFFSGCIFLLVVGVRNKKEQSDEWQMDESNEALLTNSIYTALGVPQDAVEMDILSFTYVQKNGEPQAKPSDADISAYDNHVLRVFKQEEQLCMADIEGKYAFPLRSLRAIHTVHKKITIPLWMKEKPHNQGFYKQFHIHEDELGDIHFKPYHILELEHNGEIWGIYFPCYELPIVEKLTGLKAE